jgi:hypothetical protein
VIIHGVPEPLFATEVPLGSLHRNVAEQELDLFQFTTCLVAQARTGSEGRAVQGMEARTPWPSLLRLPK